MPTLTETVHTGEHMVSEANNERSREQIIVGSAANLLAGTVLGRTDTSTPTVTPAAAVSGSGGTVGNGAVGTWTADAGVMPGKWRLEILNPAANAGSFRIVRPDGVVDGIGTVAVAYNGQLNGTLADGANDWVEDDYIVFDVSYPTPAYKYYQLDPAGVTGIQFAAGILFRSADAASADVRSVAHVRDCEVNADIIAWPSGISAANKQKATNELAALGIILR